PRSFHGICRVREYFPYGRKHRFNGNVIGTSVAYRSVAIDAGPLARALVAWRLQDGGNWIERLPMPGAGWTKDCDRWPTDCCRYMHQPGIIPHRNRQRDKEQGPLSRDGSGGGAAPGFGWPPRPLLRWGFRSVPPDPSRKPRP